MPQDCPEGFTMYQDGPQPKQDIKKKIVFRRNQRWQATCIRCSDENYISDVCFCDFCIKIFCLFCAPKHYCRTLGQSMNPDHRAQGNQHNKRSRDDQPTYTQEQWEEYHRGGNTQEGTQSASPNQPPEFAAYEVRMRAQNETAARFLDLENRLRDKQLALFEANRLIGSLELQVKDQKNEINHLHRQVALKRDQPSKGAKGELESPSPSRNTRRRQNPPATQGKLQQTRRDSSPSPRRRRSRSPSGSEAD